MHAEAFAHVTRYLNSRAAPPRLVVDLGGQDINSTARGMNPRGLFRPPTLYYTVDIAAGPGVDVVADAASFTPTAAPDLILCLEVLEHTLEAAGICQNALRVLAPGGAFVVTCAGPGRDPHSGRHEGSCDPDEYYHNVSPAELEEWCQGFLVHSIVYNREHCDTYGWFVKGI